VSTVGAPAGALAVSHYHRHVPTGGLWCADNKTFPSSDYPKDQLLGFALVLLLDFVVSEDGMLAREFPYSTSYVFHSRRGESHGAGVLSCRTSRRTTELPTQPTLVSSLPTM
jgi:hypothetical protein